jgi:two-component system, OmpR family, sensor kinase
MSAASVTASDLHNDSARISEEAPVRSVRARLLVWLLSGVLFVGAIGGWMVYRNALAEADAFFDYHLRQTALLLSDQPVEYLLNPAIPQTSADYDFVVQVWTLDGVRVYLSRPHAVLPAITTIGFSNAVTNEGRWRVFGVQAPTKVIQVAQPMSVREHQAVGLALRTLTPFALLLPLLAILIWFAVGHALEPLKRLTQLVKSRKVTALDSLPDAELPSEVQPLVGALNDLLGRLAAALERERGFLADAAHELRTPLTALYLQMGTLARASNEAERADAMERLSAGVQRAIRLVEQLLSLARQEPRADVAHRRVRLDDLAREVVAEMIPLADARQIDLGISTSELVTAQPAASELTTSELAIPELVTTDPAALGSVTSELASSALATSELTTSKLTDSEAAVPQPVFVRGDPDALRTLIRNLVDNAVRYTPVGGKVDVFVHESTPASGKGASVRIVDTGPGIPADERHRVFDRFYRPPGMSPPGSGLGMAIVKAIADAHGATISMDSGPGGGGLAVTVSFPPA